MDRQILRETLLDILEQETWERPETLADDVLLRDGLKLDSVDMLSVMLRVEAKLEITLNNNDFAGIETVGSLLDLFESKLRAKPQAKAA